MGSNREPSKSSASGRASPSPQQQQVQHRPPPPPQQPYEPPPQYYQTGPPMSHEAAQQAAYAHYGRQHPQQVNPRLPQQVGYDRLQWDDDSASESEGTVVEDTPESRAGPAYHGQPHPQQYAPQDVPGQMLDGSSQFPYTASSVSPSPFRTPKFSYKSDMPKRRVDNLYILAVTKGDNRDGDLKYAPHVLTEFRHLWELLRQRLSTAANAVIDLQFWQEGLRSIEDIHNLLIMSKKPPKPYMMATYYEKLGTIFSDYKIIRQKKKLSEEEHQRLSSIVLLSALSIPIISTSRARAGVDGDQNKPKPACLSNLLRVSRAPTRESLLKRALGKAVFSRVKPMSICKKIGPILSRLAENKDLEKLHQAFARCCFYTNIKIASVVELATVPKPYNYDIHQIAKALPAEQMRSQLVKLAKRLHTAVGLIHPETVESKAEARREASVEATSRLEEVAYREEEGVAGERDCSQEQLKRLIMQQQGQEAKRREADRLAQVRAEIEKQEAAKLAGELKDHNVKMIQEDLEFITCAVKPTPLLHYLFLRGGSRIHLVVDEKLLFREGNFERANTVLWDKDDDGAGGGKKGKPGYIEAQSSPAECYGSGAPGFRIYESAFKLYEKPLEQSHPAKHIPTAVCYEVQTGTSRSSSKSGIGEECGGRG
ncbi:eukaryotic translation initiation factor 3 subunit A [Rhizophlyctis rosea]|nr:eukaryotic translation initiation factor 3 subunit A [Rhizophlyctis rosea]